MNAPATALTEISRAEINKANSQHSTGPITAEGKSKSSLNAVKTGLTGRTVLLPTDDADTYRNHVRNYIDEFAPVGPRESELVQALADHAWRLDRLVTLEMSIYALGHDQFTAEFEDHDPSQRPGLIQLRTHFAYEKQLRNLQIQEARLRRHREKDAAELKQLQQTRLAQASEEQQVREAVAQSQGKTFDHADDGFEFSTAEIERLAASLTQGCTGRVAGNSANTEAS